MLQQANIAHPLLRLILAASVGLAGCSQGPGGPPTMPKPEVGVMTLETQRVILQSQLPGRTTPSVISDVRPQVSGIVQARLFEEGSQVKAGQVLYRIDPSTYQAAHAQAKADLANAEATVTAAKLKHERYADLLSIEGVSRQEADDAQAAYQQALATVELKKAALQSTQINLNYTQVRAPVSGRIGKSSVTSGALVTANQETALATIRALDPIYVDLVQSSAELLNLRRLLETQGVKSGRLNVRLKLEDGSDYAQAGTLKFQEVAVDETTGSVTLRAQFPNPDGVLLPGMYVRAVLDEAVQNAALLAPQQSITRDANGNAVAMVVGKDNRIEQRTVVTQRAIGHQWLISEGLNPGDLLVVEGLNKIRSGEEVRTVAVTIDPATSSVQVAAARVADPAATSDAPARGR